MKKRVLVGFSGGVDSCTSALLLKEMGYEVVAFTLDVTSHIAECKSGVERTLDEARSAAQALGIEHIVSDRWQKQFEECVVSKFIDEYSSGRTPNPCVMCNPNVKFKALIDAADENGCEYIATGHYARVVKKESGESLIACAKSIKRDQSYMLVGLAPEVVSRIIFPLGEYEKDEVRQIAKEHGLALHKKPDSQENCFIPDNDHASFIKRHAGISSPEGYFIDKNGKILGTHEGIINYTIGQRRGLKIALGERVFVTAIDAEKNTVILGRNEELFSDTVFAKNCVFHIKTEEKFRAYAKIRSAQMRVPCLVTRSADNIEVKFDEPVRAATPGQYMVIYDEDSAVIGGGVII